MPRRERSSKGRQSSSGKGRKASRQGKLTRHGGRGQESQKTQSRGHESRGEKPMQSDEDLGFEQE